MLKKSVVIRVTLAHKSASGTRLEVAQSCPTLCDRMDYIVHGIHQATTLEWVAVPLSKGSSQPRGQMQSPALREDSLPAEPPGKPNENGRRPVEKRDSSQRLLQALVPRLLGPPSHPAMFEPTHVMESRVRGIWCQALERPGQRSTVCGPALAQRDQPPRGV